MQFCVSDRRNTHEFDELVGEEHHLKLMKVRNRSARAGKPSVMFVRLTVAPDTVPSTPSMCVAGVAETDDQHHDAR